MSREEIQPAAQKSSRRTWLLVAAGLLVAALVTVGLYFLLAPGDGQSPVTRGDLVGTWQTDDRSLVLEFTPAGETKYTFSAGGFTNQGTGNTVLHDGRILGPWEMNMRWWKVSLDGKTMSLTAEDGSSYTLQQTG